MPGPHPSWPHKILLAPNEAPSGRSSAPDILVWRAGRHRSRTRRLGRKLLPVAVEDSGRESLACEGARAGHARLAAARLPSLVDNSPRSLCLSGSLTPPCTTAPTKPSERSEDSLRLPLNLTLPASRLAWTPPGAPAKLATSN